MIFYDVTLMIGRNSTLEYDSTGSIIEKELSLNNSSIPVADDKVGKFTIIKDPVINHVNIYTLELYDLPIEIINMFKSNLITAVVIRLGNSLVDGIKNFNLFKVFIRPITIYEHAVQEDKVINDIIIKGISLLGNAILLDSSFGSEIEMVDTTSVSENVRTPKAKSTPGYKDDTTLAPVNLLNSKNDIGIAFNNPGNLDRTSADWLGKIYDNNARQEKFITPEYGVRAWAINASGKIKNGYDTVNKLLTLLTPPKENNTSSYIKMAADTLGWTESEIMNRKITDADLANVLKVIIPLESDRKIATNYYTNDIINKGFSMAGMDSTVTINPGAEYYIGGGVYTNINKGTNINKFVNVLQNTRGFDVLHSLLQKMKEKYGVELDGNTNGSLIISNFLYKIISLPSVTTLELMKKIHRDYPPYMANIPWILDDAKPTNDINKVGKTFYTEINILAIDSLDYKSMKNIYNDPALAFTMIAKDNFRQFYDETITKAESRYIIFKDLTNNQVTNFPGIKSIEVVTIPNPEASTSNSEGVKKININSGEVLPVEAIYDAVEFKKRYQIFLNHLKINPQLVKCTIQTDNPDFIDFGYAYTFSDYDLNKVTPYKIKMEFRNVNNKFRLKYEVDFYKGIGIIQA